MYTKQTWANGALGGTPISAARLSYMEDGIEATAPRSFPTYAAFQATLDALDTAGDKVVLQVDDSSIDSTIMIPDNVTLWCNGIITYTGNGTGILYEGSEQVTGRIRLRRSALNWHTGVDTSSIGIQFKNVLWGEFDIFDCQNFETGIDLLGDGSGTSLNTFNLGRITNNKVGMTFRGIGVDGYVNSNVFIGGVIRIDVAAGVAGSRYIDLTDHGAGAGNGNTFIGIDLEGIGPEKAVECAGVSNLWDNCRWETSSGVHFLADSRDNCIWFGVGNQGHTGVNPMLVVTDDASPLNHVIGPNNAGSIVMRALRLSGAMVSSSTVRANSGLASEVSIGAFGPGAEAGVAFGTALDTFFYRYGAGYLGVPNIRVAGRLLTTDSAAGTTPGTVVKKLPIYDGTNTLLGYIAVYDAIT